MQVNVKLISDDKKKILTVPYVKDTMILDFTKHQTRYEIKPTAIGYEHIINFNIPDNLKVVYRPIGKKDPSELYFEGVKRLFMLSVKGKRTRNVEITKS